MEEEKVEALCLISVSMRSRDVIQEYTMSTTEHPGEQLVIHERMMQDRALLPKFAVEEYFLQICGKDPEEVVEISPVTWLLLVPLIAFDNKLGTATVNKMLTSATSIPDMRMSALFLPRMKAM